ncbi:hypothetical protein MBLNU230_g7875t1 [Neophaeotheca triangularis]
MSSAVYRTATPSLSVPQTENTAPVLEYNCLYTHDLRRKQKRWQDGLLRYHAFNKRVMVWDVPRNLIGETYLTSEEAPQDGDEVTLDKGGGLVQVADCCGHTQTDLTDLKASKKSRTPHQIPSSPVRAVQAHLAIQTPIPIPARAPGTGVQLKHRSLNALLGTPKGPIGKAALPTRSPFEEKHGGTENEGWEEGRPPKKPRLAGQPAWNVTRTTTPSKRNPQKEAPLWARTADSRKKKGANQGQQRLGMREVIDLSADADEDLTERFLPGFSSDALAPMSSPQKGNATPKPVARSSPPPNPGKQSETHPSSTSKGVDTTLRTAKPSRPEQERGLEQPGLPTALSEHTPAVRNNKAREREDQAHSARLTATGRRERPESTEPISRSENKTEKLRIASSAPKKKTLLCHTQLTSRPSRARSTNTDDGAAGLLDAVSQEKTTQPKTQRQLLEERLARMKAKDEARTTKRVTQLEEDWTSTRRTTSKESRVSPLHGSQEASEQPQSALEATRTELGRLDQMLVQRPPTAPPPEPTNAHAPSAPMPRKGNTFRRVASEADSVIVPKPQQSTKRVAGAPVRYTPSSAKSASPNPGAQRPEQSKTAPLVSMPNEVQEQVPKQSKTAPRVSRPAEVQRFTKANKKQGKGAVSLNTSASGTSTAIFAKPFRTPRSPVTDEPEPPKDLGPWSREASDLLVWRPPGWDEENWCPSADAANGAQVEKSGNA